MMRHMTKLLIGIIWLVPGIGLGLATQLYAALASYAPSLGASWSPFGEAFRLYPPWQLVVWALGDGPLSTGETLLASAPAGLSLAVALTMLGVVVRAKQSSNPDGSGGSNPRADAENDLVHLATPDNTAKQSAPFRPANVHQEMSARRAHERMDKHPARHDHSSADVEDNATRRLSPSPSVVVDSSILESANPWEPDTIVTPECQVQDHARKVERGVTPRDNPFASAPPPVSDDEKVNPFEARTVVATDQDAPPFDPPSFEEDEVRFHRVAPVDTHESEQDSPFDPPTADYDLTSQTRRLGTEEMAMLEGLGLLDDEDGEGRS